MWCLLTKPASYLRTLISPKALIGFPRPMGSTLACLYTSANALLQHAWDDCGASIRKLMERSTEQQALKNRNLETKVSSRKSLKPKDAEVHEPMGSRSLAGRSLSSGIYTGPRPRIRGRWFLAGVFRYWHSASSLEMPFQRGGHIWHPKCGSGSALCDQLLLTL